MAEGAALRADAVDLLDLVRGGGEGMYIPMRGGAAGSDSAVPCRVQVRVATVEVIEAIAKWRRLQLQPTPFLWNGLNYMLKV